MTASIKSKKIVSIFLIIAALLLSLPLNDAYALDFGLGDTAIDPFQEALSNTGGLPGVADGAGGIISGAVGGALVPVSKNFDPKEYILDPLLNAMGVALVRTMSQSIGNWIRGGFEGKPLFVTDWEGFLRTAGNEAFGLFMDDLIRRGAPDICSPFRTDVVLGLVSAGSRLTARCTLDRVVANVNSLYDNFETYGWTGYAAITTANVANNAFGSFLLKMDETQSAILQKTTGLQQEAQASRGFLSWKECAQYWTNPDTGERVCASKKTVTPGSYVADSLSLPQEYSAIRAAVADEFNELISVVAQELLNNAISGSRPKGFLDNRPVPPPNYTDIIKNQRNNLLPILQLELIGPETQYVGAKQLSASTLMKTTSALQELARCNSTSKDAEIARNRDALERIKTEFNLADIKLARYENILRDVRRTNDVAEISNLSQLIVGLRLGPRPAPEIADAQAQASALQTNLDALLSELRTCSASRQFLALSAFPSFIASGRSSLLSWSSVNANSCSISGGLTGSRPVSGEERVFPQRTSNYRLTCSGPSGSLSATTTIIVSP